MLLPPRNAFHCGGSKKSERKTSYALTLMVFCKRYRMSLKRALHFVFPIMLALLVHYWFVSGVSGSLRASYSSRLAVALHLPIIATSASLNCDEAAAGRAVLSAVTFIAAFTYVGCALAGRSLLRCLLPFSLRWRGAWCLSLEVLAAMLCACCEVVTSP